jgi:hypothetical protein
LYSIMFESINPKAFKLLVLQFVSQSLSLSILRYTL